MKKFNHPVLGHFIAEQFERAHLSIEAMRKEIHMGKTHLLQDDIWGDLRLSDFTRLFSYYYDNLTKEEFRAKMVEWGELYIEYREKNEDVDENLNQE